MLYSWKNVTRFFDRNHSNGPIILSGRTHLFIQKSMTILHHSSNKTLEKILVVQHFSKSNTATMNKRNGQLMEQKQNYAEIHTALRSSKDYLWLVEAISANSKWPEQVSNGRNKGSRTERRDQRTRIETQERKERILLVN